MTRQPHPDASANGADEAVDVPPGAPATSTTPARIEPRRRATPAAHLLRVLSVTGMLVVLGFPLGIVWQFSTPRVKLLHVEGGWGLAEENPEQYMAADGLFALIGIGVGIVVAIVVWATMRRNRGPLMLTGLVVGSILCQTVAWRFGRIGRDEYQAALDTVPVGWSVWRAPELLMTDFNIVEAGNSLLAGDFVGMMSHLSLGVLATMALAAAFTYTICAGWSRWPSLMPESHRAPQPVPQAQPPTGQAKAEDSPVARTFDTPQDPPRSQ